MPDSSSFARLVRGYFHQDVFDTYSDEFAAIDAFVASAPERAAEVPADIAVILDRYPDEFALERYLDELGSEVDPGEITYREWLTRIADRVSATTGQR